MFEGLASCYASVLPEDRKEGFACLDIGSQSSELVVYFGDAMTLAATIPICGDHFTRDIAHFLRVSPDDAAHGERRIRQRGIDAGRRRTVSSSCPSWKGREAREASRKRLNEIIEIRAEELFQMVKKELTRVGMHRSLTSGLVLTGGGSHLHGLCDIAEHVLDCQARLGLGIGIQDWPSDLDEPSWSTAAGLAMYSARLHTQVDLERQSIGLLGRILR